MNNSSFNILIAALFILEVTSCNHRPPENLSVYKALEENLKKSNKEIVDNTNSMVQRFRSYSNDPNVNLKSDPLLEYMLLVTKLSNAADSQVESIRVNFEKIALDKKSELENNSEKVNAYFQREKHAAEVFQILVNYQKSISQVHPELYNFLRHHNYFFNSFSASQEVTDIIFTKTYFYNVPFVAAEAILTKFQNDIKNYEHRAVRFFFDKLAYHEPVFIK